MRYTTNVVCIVSLLGSVFSDSPGPRTDRLVVFPMIYFKVASRICAPKQRRCVRHAAQDRVSQVKSSFCGYCCCMFRCRRVEMTRIVNMFTTDTAFNDSIAHSFVCNKSF